LVFGVGASPDDIARIVGNGCVDPRGLTARFIAEAAGPSPMSDPLTLDELEAIATVVARLARGRGKWFDANGDSDPLWQGR
jgi:hypothetical protein